MSDRNAIDHLGIVESIQGEQAVVKINSQSACASCHAKGACSASDQSEKILTVSTEGRHLTAGEQVRVLIARKLGLKAVAYGYIYPFLLLMLILVTMTAIGAGEVNAAIASLASLVPYYIILYLLRNKMDRQFSFRLEKL